MGQMEAIEGAKGTSQDLRGAVYADQFQHGFDDKGRITVPSDWRRSPQYESYLFVIPSSEGEGCLKVYPESWFVRLQQRVRERAMNDPQRRMVEQLAAISQPATIDAQGRIVVKVEFRKRAGIQKEALLVGANDHFEIWNPDRRRVVAKPEVTIEDLNLFGL
jgi:MraZ protein